LSEFSGLLRQVEQNTRRENVVVPLGGVGNILCVPCHRMVHNSNNTRDGWSGARIGFDRSPAQLANALLEIAAGRCLQNEQPRRDMRSVDLELHYMALANLQRCIHPDSEQEL